MNLHAGVFFLSALRPYLLLKASSPKIIQRVIFELSIFKKIRNYIKKQRVVPLDEEFNPEGNSLLILDLFVEKDHIAYISDLKNESSLQLIYFAYDVMPLETNYWDEIGREKFSRYFALAKMAKKIWSISEVTQNKVKDLLGEISLDKKFEFKWLPPTVFPDCSHRFAEGENLTAHKFIFMVGSFAPLKNHLGLLSAIKDLQGEGLAIPKIVFVGGADHKPEDLESAIQEIKKRGISVEKYVGIPNCCIGDLYKRAHFTVLPSFVEGFGLPIVESLSYGVPVITSDAASMGELLSLPGTLGFSHDGNPSLKDVLRDVLSDERVVDELRVNAMGNIGNLGSWGEYAETLERFIFEETTA